MNFFRRHKSVKNKVLSARIYASMTMIISAVPTFLRIPQCMLDKNALSQLQGLKDKIEAEKEYAEGTVKATRSRFGFVVLDDNREIFLPPDAMPVSYTHLTLPTIYSV